MTKYILDSGDPEEYRAVNIIAQQTGVELFGGTTNPTLIAKKLSGKKVTPTEAFDLQKQIIGELLTIVKGAVSAEVYCDSSTTSDQMATQGLEISKFDPRVVVKLPTNIEGLKARTILRRQGVPINNTLVFSQEQIFIINMHEKLIQAEKEIKNLWPPFISPFVGRLDDMGVDGMAVVEHAMKQKQENNFTPLVLASSIRSSAHMKRCVDVGVDLITAPAKIYQEWFTMPKQERDAIDLSYVNTLTPIAYWDPSAFLSLSSIDELMEVVTSKKLPITHPLTEKGIEKFTQDWNSIISS